MSQVGEIYRVFMPSRRTAVRLSLAALASAMMGGSAYAACPVKVVRSTIRDIQALGIVAGGVVGMQLFIAAAGTAGIVAGATAAAPAVLVAIAVVLSAQVIGRVAEKQLANLVRFFSTTGDALDF